MLWLVVCDLLWLHCLDRLRRGWLQLLGHSLALLDVACWLDELGLRRWLRLLLLAGNRLCGHLRRHGLSLRGELLRGGRGLVRQEGGLRKS